MPRPPAEANGSYCYDCSTYDIGGDAGFDCQYCESDNVIPIKSEPCPNGVTRADWLNKTGKPCDSEVHDWSTGNHVTELDFGR